MFSEYTRFWLRLNLIGGIVLTNAILMFDSTSFFATFMERHNTFLPIPLWLWFDLGLVYLARRLRN